jgi:shikimate kinase
VVLAPENREIIDAYGFTVYLQVTAAEAAARITNVSSRPLFGSLAHAEEVIKGRIPLYEEVADLTVDTAGKGTGAVAREIFGMLKERGVIWQRR